ncbi:Transcription factor jumonji (jmjC) domain-containing protein [Striga hermonthica]|uniref:Transcription factor jumonji (JmjC) domain-containing protein n=1 Tax=Striga hermonthica TaxID=68872 RepID=A0A9N7R6D1_STRHE|nr:Transcription factor jumonji (jmjC) domain-containing protein [Striga hermonthica]
MMGEGVKRSVDDKGPSSTSKKSKGPINQKEDAVDVQGDERAEPKSTHNTQCGSHGLRGTRVSKYTSDDPNDPFQMCHQCMKSDRKVVRCTKCPRRRYCFECVGRWYPELSKEAIAEACPYCRRICNCKACLRRANVLEVKYRGYPDDEREKTQLLKYLISFLMPFVEQFCHDQMVEKTIEAQICGNFVNEVKIEKVDCSPDERIYCDNCKTSIVDFHRSCPNCLYDLCLTCCKEIREGCLRGCESLSIQYVDRGKDYLHGVEAITKQVKPLRNNKLDSMPEQTPLPKWDATLLGEIPCPPKERGGCGQGKLELKCIFEDSWLSEMKEKAKRLTAACGPAEVFQSATQCPCLESSDDGQLRKCAYRVNSDDNHLYCPLASDMKLRELEHFQRHWRMGEPIIVRDVLKLASGLSWDPMVMWRAFRDVKKGSSDSMLKTLDCLDFVPGDISIHHFFKGYTEGRTHGTSWPEMLKLTGWPQSTLIAERMPRHNHEFLNALPYKEYTDPHSGILSLSAKLLLNRPELGPKTYIAYGYPEELGRGDSVTKLHFDVSDVVNVLMHTADVDPSRYDLKRNSKLQERHVEHDRKELFASMNADEKGTKIAMQEPNVSYNLGAEDSTVPVEVFPNASLTDKLEGGALWDIFRRDDVPKLVEYLRKHHKEFRHLYNRPVEKVAHPIHDQSLYLTSYHKAKLKEEFGVEPWTFAQKLGEAVFVPAGCPHQVRNLKSCIKVALGFVSPENLGECIRLTEELRALPKNHRAKADKLEVKNMAIHALHEAVSQLSRLTREPVE